LNDRRRYFRARDRVPTSARIKRAARAKADPARCKRKRRAIAYDEFHPRVSVKTTSPSRACARVFAPAEYHLPARRSEIEIPRLSRYRDVKGERKNPTLEIIERVNLRAGVCDSSGTWEASNSPQIRHPVPSRADQPTHPSPPPRFFVSSRVRRARIILIVNRLRREI